MNSTDELNPDHQDPKADTLGTNEALLRSEIGFWRELIESCDPNHPPDSMERMRHALALAEARLRHMFEMYRQASRAGAQGPTNVFYLDTSRHLN